MNKVGLAIATVTFAVFASGCASIPEPVAVANGEPLSVREHTETSRRTVKEKVGEVKSRDAKGYNRYDAVYANRTKISHYQVWDAYQGDDKISDDDLYRIAKDEEAARQVREHRESGVLLNRLGLGGVLVGAVAAGTGYFLMTKAQDGDNKTLPQGLMYGGMIGVSLGTVLVYLGMSKTNTKHPLGQERATQAADRYNASIPNGRSTTTTTTQGRYER